MRQRFSSLRREVADLFRWPTLLLALVNVAGASAITARLWSGSDAPIILAVAPSHVRAPSALSEPSRNPIDLSSIQTAALFHTSRTFYTPPVIPQIQPPPNYTLAGTLVIPQQPTVAMLIQPQSGTRTRVRAGDTLSGWTVDSIEANAVKLRHADQQFEIRAAAHTPVQASGVQRVPLSQAVHEGPTSTGIHILGNR